VQGDLPDDLWNSIDMVASRGLELVHQRVHTINVLERRAEEHAAAAEAARASAGYTFKAMNSPLNVPLMKWITSLVKIDDPERPDSLLKGLPIVGEAACSPLFLPFEVPAPMSIEDLEREAPNKRAAIQSKMYADAASADPKGLEAITVKTQKEVASRQMGPAMTQAEVTAKFGASWNGVQR